MQYSLPYLLSFALLLVASSLQARPTDETCPTGQALQSTFTSSGAGWEMCWQESATEGIVLTNVYFTAANNVRRKVLGEASLSQIQTEYDDGTTLLNMTATAGLGGSNLQTLETDECSGQLLATGGRDVACLVQRPRGYNYKYSSGNKRQGELLELFSASELNGKNYIVRWQFYDNGSILPAIGLTGYLTVSGENLDNGWEISADNTIAMSFTDSYFWRLDFDIAGTYSNDVVEEIVATPSADRTRKYRSVSTVNQEAGGALDYENKRFWRVRDQSATNGVSGHLSYELVILNYAHQGDGNGSDPWMNSDVFFTKYNSCERQAVGNFAPSCGTSVDQFTNAENISASDIVVWYRQSYHHLARDEDYSRIGVRWSGYELLPRDWLPSNPL